MEIFKWLQYRGRLAKVGFIAGSINSDGYLNIIVCGKHYKAHRLAFLYMTGGTPNQVDHINHDRKDNRWENLRPANNKINQQNQSKYKNNTSGYTGVVWSKSNKKWQAQIKSNGKNIHLGYFKKIKEAVLIRKAAEIEYGFHENHGAIMSELFSDCCGEPNRAISLDGPDYLDMGICPECRGNCAFVESDKDEH